MERFYQIAGLRLRVEGADDEMYSDDGILAEYRTQPGPWHHSFRFALCDTLPEPEGECLFTDPGLRVYRQGSGRLTYFGSVEHSLDGAYMAVSRTGSDSQVLLERNPLYSRIYPKTVLRAMELEHLLACHDTLLFHATFIDVGGKAILFTAPSGVGKSTQAQLWCRHQGAELVNGDRAGLQWRDGGAYACGVPFSGSSDVRRNVTLPLAAIICLSQAPENTVTRLTGLRAFREIWAGCTVHLWERTDMERATQTVSRLLQSVPVYALACTPDPSAAAVLHQQLTKEKVL